MSELRVHMVGNAHLDPAWMWTWDEGMEAFLSTCRSALDRIDETPGFIFTCSSAAHYRWVEEVEPELFERIRRAFDAGRWSIVGGWWTQADCNLPSGEGFIRQALLGQRYFESRFGATARTAYSPDAFGHSLGLPQLLRRCGLRGYMFCRPDPTELTLPSPLFDWRSPDGSSVLAYRVPYHYNMYETSVPKKVADLVAATSGPSALASDDRALGALGSTWAIFYGVGNHGGGPTREHIRQILEIDADENAPRLIFSSPDAFLDDVEAERGRRTIPEWSDDLQIDAPGCYSAHSQIKKLNRTCEHALLEAERISTMATSLLRSEYPASGFEAAWRQVCFNHFHDILCGVAIREALDDAIAAYGSVLGVATTVSRLGVQRIARSIDTTGDGQTLVVLNSHAWPVGENVRFELWHDIDKSLWRQPVDVAMTDDEGNEIPCQLGFTSGKIGRDRIAITFPASLPALGWRCYRVHYGRRSAIATEYPFTATDTVLENEHVRVEISSQTGGISTLVLKSTGETIVRDGAIGIVLDDRTDTWGHGVERFDHIAGTFRATEAHLVASGPTYATVRTLARFGSSWLQQDFRLAAGSSVLDVDVKIFWAEQRRMLKLGFGVGDVDGERSEDALARRGRSALAGPASAGSDLLPAAGAYAESAYAITPKPCDGRERPCGTWCAVAPASGAAVGIVTDAKHAYSCESRDGATELRLTVLRSPSYATHDPHPFDRDEDLDFIDQGVQRFRYRIVTMEGGLDGAMLSRHGALMCAPIRPHLASAHEAATPALERTFEGIRVEPSHVLATVLKRAEDGDGWIVRLYEAAGRGADVRVELPMLGSAWSFAMGPGEVRTFRLRDDSVEEIDAVEMLAV